LKPAQLLIALLLIAHFYLLLVPFYHKFPKSIIAVYVERHAAKSIMYGNNTQSERRALPPTAQIGLLLNRVEQNSMHGRYRST
jgi:uncharacterized lipoprotein YbaY